MAFGSSTFNGTTLSLLPGALTTNSVLPAFLGTIAPFSMVATEVSLILYVYFESSTHRLSIVSVTDSSKVISFVCCG